MVKKKIKSENEIRKKLAQIYSECGNMYGSLQSPRAKSKAMALEWVLGERSDI